MSDHLHKIFRLLLGLGMLAVAVTAFAKLQTPRFADTGFLGIINLAIVSYLLLLVCRHFFLLFFAMREQIRREGVGREDFAPKISIVVPAYNEEVVIASTINALKECDYPDIEVVVVDDGSSDQTFAAAVKAAGQDARFRVLRKLNGGKANALNFGIEEATSDFIFCMDADSHISRGALFAGIRHFTSPEIAAVAGSVFVLNQSSLLGRFQALEYMIGLNFFKAAQSYLGLVTIIPGPSGLFRKAALAQIGGYQSDTFAEDCDVTVRLVMAGNRVVYEPLMEVKTEVPVAALQLIKQRYRWNRGILQATKKHLSVLLRPQRNLTGTLLVLYMLTESVVLPLLNIIVAVLCVVYTATTFDFRQLSLWLIQLTLLDFMVVIFALTDTRWSARLVFYALINRFSYSLFLEVVRTLSTIEEVLGIRMGWGKLERLGVKS